MAAIPTLPKLGGKYASRSASAKASSRRGHGRRGADTTAHTPAHSLAGWSQGLGVRHGRADAPSVAAAAVAVAERPAGNFFPTLEDQATFPGIIPQTSTIPVGTVDVSRTGWKGGTAIGRGFTRETSQYAPQAISFDKADPGPPIVSMNQRFKTITKAREFAESLTVGFNLSLEAWVVSLDVSVEVSKNTEFASNGVTVSLLRSYKSAPLIFVDPARARVELNGPARKCLREKGPAEFHKRFGTHYVAGYTFGGVFNGFFQSRYESSSSRDQAKTTIEGKIGGLGVSAKARAEVSVDIQIETSSSSTRAAYSTAGWNAGIEDADGNVPVPTTVTDVETMMNAANEMEIDSGRRMEAVLAAYEDLEDYQRELFAYEEAQDAFGLPIEEFEALPKDKFQIISQLLNTEFLALDFLERVADDLLLTVVNPSTDVSQNIRDIQRDVYIQQNRIRGLFGSDEDARENWLNLAAYIDHEQALKLDPTSEHSTHDPREPEDDGDSDLVRREKRGFVLAEAVFKADELEVQYDQVLADAQEFIPNE